MTTSAIESLLRAILQGAMFAASAPVAADELTDSTITLWVDEVRRHDALVPACEISVRTQEGIVTLSGRVGDFSVKSCVDRQASKIRGVPEVLNQLTVAPSSLSGADIVYAIRRRILGNAAIASHGIVVLPARRAPGGPASRPARHSHRPLVVRDAATRLRHLLHRLCVEPCTSEDDVTDRDVILIWTRSEKRVLTGADILGRPLPRIATRRPVTAPQ